MGCIVSRHSASVRPQHQPRPPGAPPTIPAPTTAENAIPTSTSDESEILESNTLPAHEAEDGIHTTSRSAAFLESMKAAVTTEPTPRASIISAQSILQDLHSSHLALIHQLLETSSTTPSQTALLDSTTHLPQTSEHHRLHLQSMLDNLHLQPSQRSQMLIEREAQLKECHEQLGEQMAVLQDMTKQLVAQGATIRVMTDALQEATEALKGRDEELRKLREEREEREREGKPYWVFEGGYRVNWA